ncbi:hypothetical protein ES706_02356 [subsurface metagenome]
MSDYSQWVTLTTLCVILTLAWVPFDVYFTWTGGLFTLHYIPEILAFFFCGMTLSAVSKLIGKRYGLALLAGFLVLTVWMATAYQAVFYYIILLFIFTAVFGYALGSEEVK